MKQEGAKVQPLNVSHIHALALVMYVILQLQIRRLLGLNAPPPLMMSSMVLHGIISLAVGAKLKPPKGLPLLCVRNVGKPKLPVLQSKSFILLYSHIQHQLLMCFPHRYLTKLSVYDNNDQACFVLLGDAERELTSKTAAELVANYFEVFTTPSNLQVLNRLLNLF